MNGAHAFEAGISQVVIQQIKNPGEGINLQSEALQKELDRLYEIEKQGGWKKITSGKKFYSKGESAITIKQLKQRLRVSGDFNSDDTTSKFTDELVAAVKKLQKRFGFEENGVVDPSLIKQLNIPVSDRIDQLLVNMERLRTLPAPTPGTRLVANIPEFKLHVYEGVKEVFNIAIVVGTESNKTVIFNDEMKQIVFSPYWNVPPSIVQKEILPELRKNSHAIYFHDTPAKSLFAARKRTFSHGCIRLAEPLKLAQYLLRNNPEWAPAKIEEAMNGGKEQPVSLPTPVPVSITYFTAWVDEGGLLHLREDVYGLDKEMSKRIARN